MQLTCTCGGRLVKRATVQGEMPIYSVWMQCKGCGAQTDQHFEIDNSNRRYESLEPAREAVYGPDPVDYARLHRAFGA